MHRATDAEIAAAIATHRAALAALDRHAAKVESADPAFADDLITDTLGGAALDLAERAAFAALIALVPESRKGVAMLARYLLTRLENLDAAAIARWLAALAE
jgi:hypothetical protein